MCGLSPLPRRLLEAASSRFAVQPKRRSYLAAIEHRAGANFRRSSFCINRYTSWFALASVAAENRPRSKPHHVSRS
jgi:hypothetical protein